MHDATLTGCYKRKTLPFTILSRVIANVVLSNASSTTGLSASSNISDDTCSRDPLIIACTN